MYKHEKRQHLIAMRKCLRQAQKLLAYKHNKWRGKRFICHAINETSSDITTQNDCRAYVFKALQGEYTFEGVIGKLNPGRKFGFKEIMTLRQQFIDDLCHRINQELEQLGG